MAGVLPTVCQDLGVIQFVVRHEPVNIDCCYMFCGQRKRRAYLLFSEYMALLCEFSAALNYNRVIEYRVEWD